MKNNRFISIGSKCNVKHQIDKHFERGETMFFDWFGTNMDTVNLILQTDDIRKYFSPCNIIQEPNTYNRTMAKIIIKNLPKCVSIHDVRAKHDSNNINQFINKYERRFERLFQIIKTNDKLHFVHYGKIEEPQKELFIQTILKINPNCNFVLISVNDEQPSDTIHYSKHFIEFNYMVKRVPGDWTSSWLNWAKIFKVAMET